MEKLDRFCDTFGAGFGYVYPVAPIVLGGTTNVLVIDAVGRPISAVGGVLVDKNFGARRVQWSLIEIKRTIELGFGGQAGVDL